uniref:Putative Uncharacterized conserved protein n=1 Tax=Cupriavidus pinatubonensis (strain JMP 134 / LMG 1197) TaxID=264198 RepID=Q472Y9_CUPPJ
MAWTSAQGATAAMTVVDGVTGLPIAGATVVSAGAERVTANDGTFMMPMDGPDGGIAMTVRAPGYARLETVANGTTPRAIALAPLLAEEAARMGFDEVQFDYLRFPDAPGLRFSETNTSARRVAAITGFLSAARDRLRHYNIYLSADIFGYVCWNLDDTAIGQQLETLVVLSTTFHRCCIRPVSPSGWRRSGATSHPSRRGLP